MTQKDTHGAVAEVAPAMAAYAERFIEKDLWNRPELSRRDRSLARLQHSSAGMIRLSFRTTLTWRWIAA